VLPWKIVDSLSQIAIEKLNNNNFQMWKFRIMNFLMGKGYWEFVTGDEIEPPLSKNPTQQQIQVHKTWHEKTRKVLYWLSLSVSDSMIVHIQDVKSPKQASKLGIHWWRCITPIHKLAKCNLNKSCIINRKTRWTLVTILQR
jgi:hypothetical protein